MRSISCVTRTVLSRVRITYRKTKRAEQVPGFDQAPDFVIPREFSSGVVIEAKLTEDGGTARDKVTRVQHLGQLSMQGQPGSRWSKWLPVSPEEDSRCAGRTCRSCFARPLARSSRCRTRSNLWHTRIAPERGILAAPPVPRLGPANDIFGPDRCSRACPEGPAGPSGVQLLFVAAHLRDLVLRKD